MKDPSFVPIVLSPRFTGLETIPTAGSSLLRKKCYKIVKAYNCGERALSRAVYSPANLKL